jgi:hypothetical protein
VHVAKCATPVVKHERLMRLDSRAVRS